MAFKNILVPYDASEYSNRAFERALEIAKKDGSKITVFTVIEGEYSAIMGYSKISSQVIEKQKKATMKHIHRLESAAKSVSVPIYPKIKQGSSIVDEIINLAKSRKSDLIVIGSHGRAGLKRFILGSVSNAVAQQAKCPVLIIK